MLLLRQIEPEHPFSMKRVTPIDLLAAIVYTTVPGATKGIDKMLNIPPSDCNNCRHKQHPQGGHCYMFRNKPEGNCAQYDSVPPRKDPATEAK